jgi:hypothetical protein
MTGPSEPVETAGTEVVRRQPGFAYPYQLPPGSVSTVDRVVRHVPNYNYRAVWVINYVTGILETLLVLRFLVKLFGALPDALFTILLYGITEPFVFPFQGMFVNPTRGPYVFESSSVVAMVVYPLLSRAITSLIKFKTRQRGPWEEIP